MMKFDLLSKETVIDTVNVEEVSQRKIALVISENAFNPAVSDFFNSKDIIDTLDSLTKAIEEFGVSAPMMKAVDPNGELCDHISLVNYDDLPLVPTNNAMASSIVKGIEGVNSTVCKKLISSLKGISNTGNVVIDNSSAVMMDLKDILSTKHEALVMCHADMNDETIRFRSISAMEYINLSKNILAITNDTMIPATITTTVAGLENLVINPEFDADQVKICRDNVDLLLGSIAAEERLDDLFGLSVVGSQALESTHLLSPVLLRKNNEVNGTLREHGYCDVFELLKAIDACSDQCTALLGRKRAMEGMLIDISTSIESIESHIEDDDNEYSLEELRNKKKALLAYSEFVISFISLTSSHYHAVIEACDSVSMVADIVLRHNQN